MLNCTRICLSRNFYVSCSTFAFHATSLSIVGLFGYCKGGTSWMRNKDWSILDIGKS